MQVSLFNKIPHDLIETTFPFLDEKDLGRCSSVCQHWNVLTSTNFLWQQLYPGIENIAEKDACFKEYIKRHNIKRVSSIEELKVVAGAFFTKINHTIPGYFICKFPFNPGAYLTIDCPSEGEPLQEVRELYLLTQAFDPSGFISRGTCSLGKKKIEHAGDLPTDLFFHLWDGIERLS